MHISCTIITIGDELLMGQVIDTNSAFIAQQLQEIGISIHRRIAISDKAAEIKSAIEEAWKSVDIIITTGGLGPTKDDITKKTIAEYFSVGMKRDEATFLHVQKIFESRGLPFLEVNQAQADIPENADCLFNAVGTAPGMWVDHKGKILISLPGVPYEMKYLIQHEVLERLLSKFQLPALYYSHIQTSGLGESFLAKKIESIESALPSDIQLAYLPSPMLVRLRLSGNMVQKAEIDQFANQIKNELSEFTFSEQNIPIEKLVLEKLKMRNETLSLVESCTGGYLSHVLTNLEGSSEVYIGGWNVYTDNFKMNELDIDTELLKTETSISESCAKNLQINALTKTNSTYAISVVGILTPNETNPKKFAYISIGNASKVVVKKIDLIYPREVSKEAIKNVAFVTLLKEFLN